MRMNGSGPPASAQNGESSSVGRTQNHSDHAVQKTTLILPIWDVPPSKPLHPSHDLISLLSLASLYNTYVRPYASGLDDDSVPGGAGAESDGVKNEQSGPVSGNKSVGKGKGAVQRQKGTRLERGYTSLLDDCIDPVPDGQHAAPSLMPLIKDMTHQPTGPPPELWDGPIEVWPVEKWNVAALEVGSQSGYKGGAKDGVLKAEEKRQRKREARSLALQPLIKFPPGETKPNIDTKPKFDPLTPGPISTPGTPLLPVAPPSKAGINGFSAHRPDIKPGGGPDRPPPLVSARVGSVPGPSMGSASRSASFKPIGASARPATPSGSGQPGGMKRAYDGPGAGMSKKAKLAGTRSASPMPTSTLGKAGEGQQAQAQSSGKPPARPGVGKAGRARTEGM